ncbi:uncharacterized protein LOC133884715 [Phragmites australis]|uniref:uncharacterized protein LOC133884715 n=1 Tax=Phragmites australis TaxID=29695 RepID=UPI002D79DEB9|nr:uncharacterized protein LOC133884715 [Phragmites australis]
MGVEAKQDSLCSIKKALRCSIRTSWRCASEHRALFSAFLLLCLLYKSSPGFFAFLLSSSPVIICTTLLLGVLLSYGSTHLPEIDEDRKAPADISTPKFGCSSRNVHLKAYQRFSVPAIKDNIIRDASFGRANSNKHIDPDESLPLLKRVDQQDERVDAAGGRLDKMLTSVPFIETLQHEVVKKEYMKAYAKKESKDAFSSKGKDNEYANLFEDVHQYRVDGKETTFRLHSSSENVREDVETVAKPNHQGRVFIDARRGEVADVSEHKAVDGSAGKCRWGRAFSVRQRKKLADIKIEAINSVVDDQLDCSLCSPFTGVGSHDCSPGFDPDNAERYSPDVSTTNTAPVLDVTETDPLLCANFSCPDPINNDDLDNHSNISSQNSQPDSDSNDVADNSKAKDDGEEKDAGNEPAFLWTADDEKNAMDLGYSEMERNRRLEILMAKRKSRKHMDVGGIADDLSSFRPQVLLISAPRMNPFADEAEMPGSAPPILHPRKSPFDFLTEQPNDNGVPACHNLNSQKFMPDSHQDMLFKRHESFNLGKLQRHVPQFKPCFVLEEFNSEEASRSNFQRQFSDRSVSRLSVVSECDTVSSVGDQDHNELIRNYIRGVRESPNLLRQDSDLVYTGNECSDEISFLDDESLNAIIC